MNNTSPKALIIQANTIFTTNMYKILAKQKGNVFFSPISVHLALTIMHQGAKGQTEEVLRKILNNPDQKSTLEGYKTFIKSLKDLDRITLVIANKIYLRKLQKQVKFTTNFQDIVKEFDSEIDFLDLADRNAAAKTINSWVENKTQNQIKNLVNENSLSQDTKLMIINAIYFKGDWLRKFDSSLTRNAKFFIAKDEEIEVKMMYQKGFYQYYLASELGAQILQIPYKGLSIKFMIILPEDQNKLEEVESKIVQNDIGKICENLQSKEVHLFLPKFKIEKTIKLNDVLIEMGLKNIFDMKEANFSKILDKDTTEENLFVGDVLQKTFIEVNETGTVAAAATRTAMVVGSAKGAPKPIVFRVDHPAIFLLIHVCEDNKPNCLFYGRLCHPEF